MSPLAIDLDFDGVELVSLANGTHVWDIDNDGLGESTGWVAADDGLLAIDLNEDGVINNHAELFGTATTDGFTILSGYDSNGDGVIDASDADFSSLLIWRDANQNGYSESTEIQTLSEWGIVSIALGATEVSYSLEGNPVTHESTVTWSSTAQSDVVDAWFVTDQFNSTFVGEWTPDVRVANDNRWEWSPVRRVA